MKRLDILTGLLVYSSKVDINAPRNEVWPLLTGAAMVLDPPWWFRFGIPTPTECRMVETEGRRVRMCLTDRGRVEQLITTFKEPELLEFERLLDNAGLARVLKSMHDRFTLDQYDEVTRLSRTTTIQPVWHSRGFLRIALPIVHSYVNQNFKILAEKGVRK
jgi:uncharacterized protein YndB with AHSA1/START domain